MNARFIRPIVIALLQCLALAGWCVPTRAEANHVAAQLVAPRTAMPGEAIEIALLMRPEPGWHGYWLNPGDAGLGMTLDWSAPYGTAIGAPRYPVPDTLLVSGLMNHVYENEYAVLVPVRMSIDARPGSTPQIVLDAHWLACSDKICVPEQARLETAIAIGARASRDPRFDAWQAKLPAPLLARAHFAVSGDRLRLAIPLPAGLALSDPHFFAAQDKVIAYAASQSFVRAGDTLVIDMARPALAAVTPASLSGVLRLDTAGNGLAITAVPGPVPAGGKPLATASRALPSLAWLLFAALAGGMILNVMPCVFPILSLKAISLARAGESAAQARAEGLAYTLGAVIACLGLGGLMLALRAGGEQIGWAFQLQEPGVVAGLLLLATAITANLLGLFELAIPGFARAGSPQGAFATGLLAAFVATPCTGPFMAAAMGAALLLAPLPALALFAALGLGLALPFLAIALVPPLRAALPRPGRWMVTFRRWLAFPMGLTALALVWLTSRLGGWPFAAATLACAALLVMVLCMIGARQRSGRGSRGAAFLALALAAVAVVALPMIARMPAASDSAGILPTRPFSQAALDRARSEGKPVFAWFTADWCLTCKVNERVAIERPEVASAFARAGVVVLKGDWTRRDPAITRYLESQGAAGVPLYVWYPAHGAPRQLPQILERESLTALVR